jgi:hypothetical protein
MPKKPPLTLADAMDEFMAHISTNLGPVGKVPIVEFAEQVLFNGDIKLFPQQRAVVKAFYSEELDSQEEDILYGWKEIAEDGDTRTNWVPGREYTSLVIEAGRRGSKSAIASIITLYEKHNLLLLPNPGSHYGLLPSEPIALFLFSQSQEQSNETLFGKLRGWCDYSQYFSTLQESKVLEVLREEIRSSSKNIGIYSKHTNSPALVGYSLKLILLDEVARFTTTEEGKNVGDELWDNVGAGVSTFGKEGRKVAISSAWCQGDNIQKLWELSKQDPSILSFRLRTWDLNPNMTRNNPIVVSAYAKDTARARLEYEGIRATGQGNFIDLDRLKSAQTGNTCMDSKEVPIDISSEQGVRYYAGVEVTRLESLTSDEKQSYAHMDYGVKRDSAAFAIARPVKVGKEWFVQVDGYLNWTPYRDAEGRKRNVNIANVEDVLLEVCRVRKVSRMSFDCYQSEHTIQALHEAGVYTEELSASRGAQYRYYSIYRDLLVAGKLIRPKDTGLVWEVNSQLSDLQLRGVDKDGQIPKIVHNAFGKDLADAEVSAVYQCHTHMIKAGMGTNISPTASIVSKAPQVSKASQVDNVSSNRHSARGYGRVSMTRLRGR